MKTVCLLLLFFLALSVCADAASQDVSAAVENRLLESELLLAKKPNLYFIFNLKDKIISFRSRGIALREIKVEDVKFWGGSVDAAPRQLVSKYALNQPQRDTIDPEKNKEEETAAPAATTVPAPLSTTPGAFDIKALELQDMPTSYRLVFQENIQLSVRAKTSGFKTRLYNTASYAGWYISRPILTLWNSYKGRPFTSIYLVLNEEDARALYWSIIESSQNIIYNP